VDGHGKGSFLGELGLGDDGKALEGGLERDEFVVGGRRLVGVIWDVAGSGELGGGGIGFGMRGRGGGGERGGKRGELDGRNGSGEVVESVRAMTSSSSFSTFFRCDGCFLL
jgi:hypothetical protein